MDRSANAVLRQIMEGQESDVAGDHILITIWDQGVAKGLPHSAR